MSSAANLNTYNVIQDTSFVQLQSIRLQNIRSYTDQTIEFADGITLLSGDIGSGKSTILLAIEFALFGIRRGDISGEGLLRHGEQTGSVTCTFTCGSHVVVHRQLKKSSRGVQQANGYLEVDGVREELTAQELKARILDLLGYPAEQLTKAKGFVFRYTVYTPQETMKQILYEAEQTRLNTLRTVFGVDTYKQVIENSSLLVKKIREDKRHLEGQVVDMHEIEDQLESLHKEKKLIDEQLTTAQSQEKTVRAAFEVLEKQGKAYEQAHAKEQQRLRKLTETTAKIESFRAEQKRSSLEKEQITKKLEKRPEPVSDPRSIITKAEENKSLLLQKKSEIAGKQSHFKQQFKSIRERADAVTALDVCPTCEQTVGESHKEHVAAEAKKQEDLIELRVQKATEMLQTVASRLTLLESKLQELRTKEKAYLQYMQADRVHTELESRKQSVEHRIETIEQQVELLLSQQKQLEESDYDEAAYKEHTEKQRQKQRELQEIQVLRAGQEATKKQLQLRITQYEQKREQKKTLQKHIRILSEQENWLTEAFMPVTMLIEKERMRSIHHAFSQLFTQWFLSLVDDEAFFAQLSQSFTPIITQNGYDAEINHLSGGEKTSLALAYRLALNAVVTNVLQTLKTADLLILDEPTDGFSTEQLDRVRDVLAQLDCSQLILVSHEQKMESFVDRVIRVEKRDHVSIVHV